MTRHNEKHEWQTPANNVLTSGKPVERFSFPTLIPVFMACGKLPRNMVCILNSFASWVQQLVFPTFSHTWTPTPGMTWQFAQICPIRVWTIVMVRVCSSSCMMDHVWTAICWILSTFVFIALRNWCVFHFFPLSVSWKNRSYTVCSDRQKKHAKKNASLQLCVPTATRIKYW